ncbi:MAG: COR domain-containing protein [Methanobacterium sp.]
MTEVNITRIIKETYERNLTELDLSGNQLTKLPSEIMELKNITKLNLSRNQLICLPPEIAELKNLTELDLSGNQLTKLPPEIVELKNLIEINLSENQLTQLPPEIAELKNLTTLFISGDQLNQLLQKISEFKSLTTLGLSGNQLTRLPPEITKLKNITKLLLFETQLTQLPQEIGDLKDLKILVLSGSQLTETPIEITKLEKLTELYLVNNPLSELPSEILELGSLAKLLLSENQLTKIPSKIKELKNLKELYISESQLTQLPSEIYELKEITTLLISGTQLTKLPPGIGEFKNLIKLDLSGNQLTNLPPEIGKLKNLIEIDLSRNLLTQLPSEIIILTSLKALKLSENPLISPPPEIVSRGLEAIFTYLKQLNTSEHNEAKLILVGNGEVGKTCLVNRLIYETFGYDMITEGINVSQWSVPAPIPGSSPIKLNIWDFGGQEIYHATHQFFLTARSVYLLVWNARKTRDYDHIYYWLHTIEAFGEDSPVILVMSKMNENDDDLNLKDLESKFPQIAGYLKIDSKDGRGIKNLKEKISETAWNLPLMRVRWTDSWYRVREKLENLEENWITYDKFYEICVSEGLDNTNISILDGYLHELGVTLHFKDRIALNKIVILKPGWATGAFYKILSAKSILQREGILLRSELDKIWDIETYPTRIYTQLMELMNKFELAYELPDRNSYLIPELLPKNTPNFEWNDQDNLSFYYCYDFFLPHGIITRFIVRMHEHIEKKWNDLPLCWREGALLKLQNSWVLVKMSPDEKRIEIRIKGDNKRGALAVIRYHLDHINASIKKIKVSEQIPCNCSENCNQMYYYENLLEAEKANVKYIQCHKSYRNISISTLLDGYEKREERFKDYNESSGQLGRSFVFSPSLINSLETEYIKKAEENKDMNNVVDLKIELPLIHRALDNLIEELEHLNLKLDSDLDKIQDSLDEVNASSDKENLVKPLNKLYRLLEKMSNPNSDYNKIILEAQNGIELTQKLIRTYNKLAQWLEMPLVPDLFFRK